MTNRRNGKKESSESSQNGISTVVAVLGSSLGSSISHHVHFVHLIMSVTKWNIASFDELLDPF